MLKSTAVVIVCWYVACNAQAIYKCGYGRNHPERDINEFMSREDDEGGHDSIRQNGMVIDTWTGNLADGSRHPDVMTIIESGNYNGLNLANHPNVDLICSRGMPALLAYGVLATRALDMHA